MKLRSSLLAALLLAPAALFSPLAAPPACAQAAKVAPVVTWVAPAAILHGTVLSSEQLNASANVPGTFSYSPAVGTLLAPGPHKLTVTFTPSNGSYASGVQSVGIFVHRVAPVIAWAIPASIPAGTPLSAAQLNASTTVAGTFTYTPAVGTVLPAGPQTLKVTFTPNDLVNFVGTSKIVSVTVGSASGQPVITWPTPAAIAKGTALSAAQLNASANVPGTFSYSPGLGTMLNPGTATLTTTFTPSNGTIAPITKSVSLLVNKFTPLLFWTPASLKAGAPLSAAQLNATAYIAGTFSYSPASGTKLGAGNQPLSVTFTPSDTTNFTTATKTVILPITGTGSTPITPTAPAISWATPAAVKAGTALSASQLDATASVPGTFSYSPAVGTVISSNTVLTASFTPSDDVHYTNATAQVTLSVGSSPAKTSPSPAPSPNPSVTTIAIDGSTAVSGAKRLGINLSGQTFYDSGQMLRNLAFRNPGFEGETFQTILHCVAVTATTCTDANTYTVWPANFVQGASFQFITGQAVGMTGTVSSSTTASGGHGIILTFPQPSTPPAAGDFIELKMTVPGNAQAGWWTSTTGSATLATEFSDLSPNSPGKQALLITAAGGSANVSSYFDSYGGRSFLQLNGSYQLTFRAKGLGGSNAVAVSLVRNTANGSPAYFSQTFNLSSAWQDYTFSFSAADAGNAIGTVQLAFNVNGTNMLLDDVALTEAASGSNPTAFRNAVVSTLTTLHPGTIRYEDSNGGGLGGFIDNALAVPFARVRTAFSTQETERDDIVIGLHEVLQLCQAVGADPWYNVPVGISPTEMQNLIQYLAGDASTPYGALRAARGQVAPWTSVFSTIHLELGNEVWNQGVFYGAAMQDPVAYGAQVTKLFSAARSAPSYSASSFDLIMGSWAAVPDWTSREIAAATGFDTVDAAPYLFNSFNDTSSTEAVFGPMLAQPEAVDSTPSGYMYQQNQIASAAGKKLAVYEVNLSPLSGTASQAALNQDIPSLGGGLAVVDHMLLMMRDLGVTTQNLWALPEYTNQFYNTATGTSSETTPLFGAVVDMGGETNLRRPVFSAEQLANNAILPNLLTTAVSGQNPTWSQPLSTNDQIQLDTAHEIQSFAFSDGGNTRSLVLINLSRTASNAVNFSGAGAPTGSVTLNQLSSPNITDTNETTAVVSPSTSTLSGFNPNATLTLPPFSMTTLTWQAN